MQRCRAHKLRNAWTGYRPERDLHAGRLYRSPFCQAVEQPLQFVHAVAADQKFGGGQRLGVCLRTAATNFQLSSGHPRG